MSMPRRETNFETHDELRVERNRLARIVVPGDGRQGRFVSNLVSREGFSARAVPAPAPGPLLLTAACARIAVRMRPRAASSPC
jgi:hypothetical protein